MLHNLRYFSLELYIITTYTFLPVSRILLKRNFVHVRYVSDVWYMSRNALRHYIYFIIPFIINALSVFETKLLEIELCISYRFLCNINEKIITK